MYEVLVVYVTLFVTVLSSNEDVHTTIGKSPILDVIGNIKVQNESHVLAGDENTSPRKLPENLPLDGFKEILEKQNVTPALTIEEPSGKQSIQRVLGYEETTIKQGNEPMIDFEEVLEKEVTTSLPRLNEPARKTESLDTINIKEVTSIWSIMKMGDLEETQDKQHVSSEQDVDEPDSTLNYDEVTSIPSIIKMGEFDETQNEENTSSALDEPDQDQDQDFGEPAGNLDTQNVEEFQEREDKPAENETLVHKNTTEQQDVSPISIFEDTLNFSSTPPDISFEGTSITSNERPVTGLQETSGKENSTTHFIDMEEKRSFTDRNTGLHFKVTPDPPVTPVVVGVEGFSLPTKSYETNHSLEEIFHRFGSLYSKILGDNFKRNFTLHDVNTSFMDKHGVPGALNGKIHFERGVLFLNTSFELVEVSVTQINEHTVIGNYMFKDPKVVLQYNYLMQVPSDEMSGTLQANLRDVEMYAPLIVAKNKDGTCNYVGYLFFYVDQDFKQRLSNTIFSTKRAFKSSDSTKKAKKIINTFIIEKDMFKHINRVLSNVSAAEPALGAEEEYHKLMKINLCDLMV